MKPDRQAQQVESDCEFRIEQDRTALDEKIHTVYDYAESAASAVRLMSSHGSKPQEY